MFSCLSVFGHLWYRKACILIMIQHLFCGSCNKYELILSKLSSHSLYCYLLVLFLCTYHLIFLQVQFQEETLEKNQAWLVSPNDLLFQLRSNLHPVITIFAQMWQDMLCGTEVSFLYRSGDARGKQ